MSEIYSFNDYRPSSNNIVLFDTSFFLSYIGHDINNDTGTPINISDRRKECNNLISKIISSNAMMAITIQTSLEVQEVLGKERFSLNDIQNEWARKELNKKDPKKYEKIIGLSTNDFNDYMRDFFNIPNMYTESVGCIDNEVQKRAMEIQSTYKIHGLGDALQIALAEQQGATHFVALDSDFKKINNDITMVLDKHSIEKD